MKKIRVAVLFGGVSSEHEVSLLSAQNVIRALNPEKYEIIKIGIDKAGKWQLHNHAEWLLNSADPAKIELTNASQEMTISPSNAKEILQGVNSSQGVGNIDVFFPILHGGSGEDGSLQGLFEMLHVPFVGPDVRASAICFDKDLAKRLLRAEGVLVAEGITLLAHEKYDTEDIAKKFGFPLFIKPSRAGSSVGVSKVKTISELKNAILEAFQHDDKVLVEKAVVGREMECAVLGNRENLRASFPAEVVPSGGHEFYDYSAKYLDENGAITEVPARISEAEKKTIQDTALVVAQILGIEGMSRVDGFLTAEGKWIINEINTIPGFTNISMYPKMWEASGLSQEELVDELVRLAIARQKRGMKKAG